MTLRDVYSLDFLPEIRVPYPNPAYLFVNEIAEVCTDLPVDKTARYPGVDRDTRQLIYVVGKVARSGPETGFFLYGAPHARTVDDILCVNMTACVRIPFDIISFYRRLR